MMVLVATLSILAAATGSAFAQDVRLQYHWTKGEEARHRLLQQTTTAIVGLPGSSEQVTVEASMSEVVRTTVEDVAADGTATLRYVYESARWETKSPTGTMTIDTTASNSANAGGPDAVKNILNALIGESFVLVMAPNGQVQKAEGLDRMIDKMFTSFRPDPTTMPMLEGFRNYFSQDGVRNAFTQGYRFPDRSLTPGDTWDESFTATIPGFARQTRNTQFTLKEIETTSGDRVARIATSVMIQSTPDPTAVLQFADSSGEGEIIFDITNGDLLRSSTRSTTSMDMSMTGPDGNAMRLHSTTKSLISVELLQP
jgi:hypothetical protein